MAVLQESYITGDNQYTEIYGVVWRGQTFTPSVSHTITQVDLKLYKEGSPGTYTISIRAVDGDHKPTGADIDGVTGTTQGNDLDTDTDGAWTEIELSAGVELTAGTEYAIVTRAISGDISNSIHARVDDSGTYGDGLAVSSVNSGGTWSVIAAIDWMFKEYAGDLIPGDSPPPASNVSYSKKLVAVGNDQLWYESSAGTMEVLAGATGDIDCTVGLDMFEAFGKVFVANGTNLKVADFVNIKITTLDIESHPPDFQTILTAAGGAKMIVDYITALTGACTIYGKLITTAEFGAEAVTGTDDDGNAISFTGTAQTAGPHWYDWTVFGNDSTYGIMPSQATLGCNYRGRAQLSGDEDYPYQWYQPRQNNPWDWNYIANDAQSPIAGGNSDAGEVGDLVIATIPYKDDYMIFGCAGSLWYLIGDAAESGTIQELSLTEGILGAKAWCWDNAGNLYILSTSGLLKIPPGFGPPENITLESYPDFVKDIAFNSSTDRITMAYDREGNGINICNTTLADGTNENWWYDLRTGGLFPDSYPEECGVYSAFFYESVNPAYKGLLFGCFDGHIRFFDPTAKSDVLTGDTVEAIDSYVDLAPMKLGKEGKEGKLTSLVGVLAGGGVTGGSQADSSDVYYKIYGEISAEKVIERMYAGTNVRASGTISAPGRVRGSMKKRKVKAAYLGIRIGNLAEAETWAMEKLLVNAKESGRIK